VDICENTDSFYSDFEAPDSYRNFMQSYADAIFYVRENKVEQASEVYQQWNRYLNSSPDMLTQSGKGKSVDPLLQCKWDQGYPYNALCPIDPAGPGGHVLAGCVATAMSQVMYYWRHPMQGTGSHSYNYYPYGNLSANFGSTTYNWAGMKNNIEFTYPDPIAELQYHCGVAVEMMYGPNGSGAYSWDVPSAMENYFGYSNDCYFAQKDNYGNTNWENMLKDNIDNGWPLYYSGFSSAGGHAFVCDGYEDNYFHFNFGWGGSSDGFYTLLSVNGFNQGQGALFDTYPAINYPNYCIGDQVLTQFSGSIDDGSGPIENYQDNSNCTWLLDPQTTEDSVSNIILEFFKFDTEANDMVAIYDGETTQDNLLAEYSGNELPETITSTGNKMLIVFSSDNTGTAGGWYAEFNAIKPDYCLGTLTFTEPSGVFNDGSGNYNYHNGSTCFWEIEPDFAETVTISFSSFETESESDRVLIYDTESQELLAEYSGSYTSSNLPDPVTSPSGKMFVAFSSTSSVTAEGWEAEYTSVLTGVESQNEPIDEFVIYPNPVNDKVNIIVPQHYSGVMDIDLISLNGKKHHSQVININDTHAQAIDVSNLLPGIYVIRFKNDQQSVYKRFIKN